MSILSYKQKILSALDSLDPEKVYGKIDEVLNSDPLLGTMDKKELSCLLINSILKYDIIQPLLEDESISEIMVNGLSSIFVESKGKIKETNTRFDSKEHLMQWISKVATEVGREVNFSTPTLDARLKDGSRVNVVLDPIALNGPSVTIRKFNRTFSNLIELQEVGMLTEGLMALLEKCIKSHYNFIIAGGTGSGKTTLLSCLASQIDINERIVVIEDAAEIKTDHLKNVVRLETRSENKLSPISLSLLIKNSLRMRPDRIIVGEVRGEESIDMLQAMNTGHDGSISTGHSNSALDMLMRLEVLASTNSALSSQLIKKQIISAIDLVLYVERLPSGERKVTFLGEVDKEKSDYVLNTIFSIENDEKSSCALLKSRIQNTKKFKRYGHERN